ncbi:unnamed protein product [Rotaria sp. Silwood1]|nr:unnamed protein product [Rotaria sp. Silwood1]
MVIERQHILLFGLVDVVNELIQQLKTKYSTNIAKLTLQPQQVDLIVVCSTLDFSREDILSKAGEITQREYAKASTIWMTNPIETSAGQLSCSKILFLRWEIDQSNDSALYRSICEFVCRGIQHAINAHYNSVAFSPICCEELGISKDLVADAMLTEAQTQLLLINTLIPIKWTQSMINMFYKYCLNHHVLPEMDPVIGYLKLSGPKECVMKAEKEFDRIKSIQGEQARLLANARDIIWAYEISDNNWEKYIPELNARMEHAHASNLSSIDFINEKHEHCRIDFKNEIEICLNNQRQCQIIRQYDMGLPHHWQIQVENVRRVILLTNTDEYNEIYTEFHQAMAGKYTEIVRIERIQNKQCDVRSFVKQSLGAGFKGTSFGNGTYFTSDAAYAHSFTHANTLNGERCMFLATVVLGETTRGNNSMKVPPPGYDSTTDGHNIFVTYRDNQAYAAYLIVYR